MSSSNRPLCVEEMLSFDAASVLAVVPRSPSCSLELDAALECVDELRLNRKSDGMLTR
jgi:hypothetical protein